MQGCITTFCAALGFTFVKEYSYGYDYDLPLGWVKKSNGWENRWTYKYFDSAGNLRLTVNTYQGGLVISDMHSRYQYVADNHSFRVFDESETIYKGNASNHFKACEVCKKYLNTNFPDWENPLAYW